jgi:hypothetical protein
MLAPHLHTFYQYACLQHPPRRYALLRSEEAQRRDQNHDQHYWAITAALLARHLAGESDLTAPVAGDCRTHLPSLDVDAGGIVAIHALICEATQRGLWSFGQWHPRIGLATQDQRGSVLIRTRSACCRLSAPTARTPRLPLASPTAGMSPARRRTIGAP